MERETILAHIAAVIADQLAVDASVVTESASFIDDLGADSLDLLQLLTALEDEFSVFIPDEDFENIKTVGDAIGVIEGLQS